MNICLKSIKYPPLIDGKWAYMQEACSLGREQAPMFVWNSCFCC
jgi:hypothetical protein